MQGGSGVVAGNGFPVASLMGAPTSQKGTIGHLYFN